MASNLAYLQTLLSGGAANTDPNKSLGGPISATRVLSQTATAPTTITGVTIEDAAGNAVGNGTLQFNYSATARPCNGRRQAEARAPRSRSRKRVNTLSRGHRTGGYCSSV